LADLTDRHYALFANNQHPLQLHVYEEYNKFLRFAHSPAHHQEVTDLAARFQEVVDQRSSVLAQKEGESLSLDDLSDIYMQVRAEGRGKANMSLNTRSKTGEINDYLEVRRPFGAAQ
jgi:hypothetical protein